MTLHPRTPVLVGIAAVDQRCEDPTDSREAFELMVAALEAAADDAGSRRLLEEVGTQPSVLYFGGAAPTEDSREIETVKARV